MQSVRNSELLLKGGLLVPLVTLKTRGKPDAAKTAIHALNVHDAGATGIVVNGTTGKGHAMTLGEKLAVIRGIGGLEKKVKLRDNFALVTGTGTQDVGEAREIIRAAAENGFHGVLALPHANNSEKKGFYEQLAQECEKHGLALLLYHHPRLDSRYAVTPRLLGELMKRFECVIGVKDSSGNEKLLPKWFAAEKVSGRKPLVAVGEDKLVLTGLRAGAQAAIAGTANTREGINALRAVFMLHAQGKEIRAGEAQARLNAQVNALLKGGDFAQATEKNRLRKTRIG